MGLLTNVTLSCPVRKTRKNSKKKFNHGQAMRCSFDKLLSVLILILTLPIIIVNLLFSFICEGRFFVLHRRIDMLDRVVTTRQFRRGCFKSLASLFDVLSGSVRLCGIPMEVSVHKRTRHRIQKYQVGLPGLFDVLTLHKATGLKASDDYQLLKNQLMGNWLSDLMIVTKSLFCYTVYHEHTEQLESPRVLRLFDLPINNVTIAEAVDWCTSRCYKRNQSSQLGFFINVNSINLAANNPLLRDHLNQADVRYADGSGMRLAAKHKGMRLRDNVNGTDLLPLLCRSAAEKKCKLYLLGATPLVIHTAKRMLEKKYPRLEIVGAKDGYFPDSESQTIVDDINSKHADILLFGAGSPKQEAWLCRHKDALGCGTALAVGGLFDFCAEQIPRAPLWMRELGLEWLYRLIQEPYKKGYRYLIGNPWFLVKVFLLNKA